MPVAAWLDGGVSWFFRRPTVTEAAPPSVPTPFQRAQSLTWPGSRPRSLFVRMLSKALREAGEPRVVLVAGEQMSTWCDLFAQAWPALSLEPVHVDDDESHVHARLTARGPFDVVVHAADTSALDQARLFVRVFMHLREGGAYLTPRMLPLQQADLDRALDEQRDELLRARIDSALVAPPLVADVWQMVAEAQASRIRDFDDVEAVGVRFRDIRGLGRHLAEVHVHSKVLSLRNHAATAPKLTEAEADAVLRERPEIGREVESLPPAVLEARAPYVHNLERDLIFLPRMEAPKLTLRRYDAPICSRGQVVTSHGMLLPDTFRHHLADRLDNIYVDDEAPRFGNVRRDISEPDELSGAWYHLDSEWPGHYGHSITELLGRSWGWARARADDPSIRPLLTVQHDRTSADLLPFEAALLQAVGIDPATVHVFDRPCRPEVLYSATSMFSLPEYVHPEMAPVWRHVGDHLAAQAGQREWPRRIFCSRPPTLKRACRNVVEVEQLFEDHGFTVVRPETHSLPDQVAMFRSAEAVAGFAGSALFTMALCPVPKPLFTIAPTSYTARNEQLIAALWGHPVVSAWCRPEVEHPLGSWTVEAFSSSFSVDMASEGRFLREQLERLEAR